jgi:hypothetical protein
MQFMLIFNESTAEAGRRDDPADATYWGAWNAYVMAMFASGCARNGHGLLHPRTGTRVRVEGGKRQLQDEALEWAAKAPCAVAGSVEVRPVLPPPPALAAA